VNPGAADAAQLATEVSKLGADKVPFAAFLGANQSLTVNGYQRLPGGMILQWGLYSIAAATNVAITYPIAFPVGTLVAGAFLPSAAIPVSTQAWTATGLSVYAGSSVTTSGVWFALGK
ncbi:MAG: gp53-like domain-containing protein, partial [Microvirgula sp.]